MKKIYILSIIEGLKNLAEIDFNQLDTEQKEQTKDYQKGYLEALNMVHMYFKEKV